MGKDVAGVCAWEECSEQVVIDSTSLDFIASAAHLDREEALLCDEHLNERIGGVTLDLSIGSGHTRSEEFEEATSGSTFVDDDEDPDPHDRDAVVRVHSPHDSEHGPKVVLDAPDGARDAIARLDHDTTNRAFDSQRQSYTVDCTTASVDHVTETLPGHGWEVEVATEVRQRLASQD